MIICSSKAEFMSALDSELTKYGITDKSEIFSDFEQHFTAGMEEGLTERQVCEKLGDISEIAKQYVDEEKLEHIESEQSKPNAAANSQSAQGFDGNSYADSQPQNTAQPSEQPFRCEAGKVIGVICVDVFVFSWVLPAFAGVIASYLSIPISLVVSGFMAFVGGIISVFGTVSFIATPFAPLSTILFGIMITALGGLATMLGLVIVQGAINVFINIINWHGRVFVGHNVIKNKFRFKKKEAAQ